ncbi:MAG: hypothetical protein VX683_02950, partial [Cyanobacteriota bacterium]|nr:hypothetical protein [Cyanobacteriota bacterium]
ASMCMHAHVHAHTHASSACRSPCDPTVTMQPATCAPPQLDPLSNAHVAQWRHATHQSGFRVRGTRP